MKFKQLNKNTQMFSSKNSILRINTDLNNEHTPDFTGDVQVNPAAGRGMDNQPLICYL